MKQLLAVILMCSFSFGAVAALQSREIVYQVDGKEFTGYLAWDDAIKGKRPGILVVHEWWGLNDYARKRADMLAKLGYTAFALDMYGTGKVADHPDDAKKFMQAVVSDMPEAKKRFDKAREILQAQPTVDARHIAAIGYCFGGGIVLNMARAGEDLDGVVSFHGSLGTQTPAQKGRIKARILVFTGAADPFAPPEVVSAFEQEMQAAGADYRLISYPGARHSFTNPGADSFGERFGMPLAYNKHADEDSWQRTQAFFREIFKD
jgi:dienelactone hydrolase